MTDAVQITIDDEQGFRHVDRMFELAQEYVSDLSEPLEEMMDALLDSVARQFETEGAAAEGVRWQPLSDIYGKWKAVHYPGFPILVASGAMKLAMLDEPTAVHIGPDLAVYEPISDIAGYHQHGETWWGNAWKHPGPYLHVLPQRKMVDLTDAWAHEAVDRTFARWLARKLGEARAAAGVGG